MGPGIETGSVAARGNCRFGRGALVSDPEQLRRSPNVQNDVQSDVQSEDLDWTIFASTPFYSSSIEHHFGSRIASASPVRLQPRHDAEACWIESLETGWMFLLPTSTESGWLLSVGAHQARCCHVALSSRNK
jgi:hypothetical protein